MTRTISSVLTLAVPLALAACATDATAPPRQLRPAPPSHMTTLDCQTTGSCPSPSADGPGLVVNGVGATTCPTTDPARDADYDGLDDSCEYALADAFAPYLLFASNEQAAGRETYWAAFPTNIDGSYAVTIIYMLGYYWDTGNEYGGPHRGDSEFIILDVIWDSGTTWKLRSAFLSAHWLYKVCIPVACKSFDRSDHYNYWDFNYDQSVYRGAPSIVVSRGKHANYNSVSRCGNGDNFCEDAGAIVSRAGVAPNRNVGSSVRPLVLWVGSFDPSLHPGTENFWQKSTFDGWNSGSDGTGGYYRALEFFEWRGGFRPTQNLGQVTVDSITGPNIITIANNYGWEAMTAGGDAVYTYRWEYRWDSDPWQVAWSTDKMYWEYIDPEYNPGNHWLYLRVTVTSNGQSSVREFTVNTSSCGQPYCGPPM